MNNEELKFRIETCIELLRLHGINSKSLVKNILKDTLKHLEGTKDGKTTIL